MSDPSDVPCNITCDVCGKGPARWFGRTSVAVCYDPECYKFMLKQWNEHYEQLEYEEDE